MTKRELKLLDKIRKLQTRLADTELLLDALREDNRILVDHWLSTKVTYPANSHTGPLTGKREVLGRTYTRISTPQPSEHHR